MRHMMLTLTALMALAATAGCSVNCEFAKGNKGYADLVLPEYKAYIDADPNLDAESKDIRKGTADKWAALIDEANEGCKEK